MINVAMCELGINQFPYRFRADLDVLGGATKTVSIAEQKFWFWRGGCIMRGGINFSFGSENFEEKMK